MALDHASIFYNPGRLALDSATTYTLLEQWMQSYRPEELFDAKGAISFRPSTEMSLLPRNTGSRRTGYRVSTCLCRAGGRPASTWTS